jgi:signal transduction histidine kinase
VRALPPGNTVSSKSVNPTRRLLNLSDWPVARRLFAVIAAALLMGVIFGGLRVADAESSASQYSRVSQLANVGQKLTVLVNDLQNERDETLALLNESSTAAVQTMQPYFRATDAGAAAVQQAAAGISGLPANIENDVGTVLDDVRASRLTVLQKTLDSPQDQFSVIGNYGADINDMITLADQVSQGVSDSTLASDVQALNALAMAKEQASQERALVNFAFNDPEQSSDTSFFNVNLATPALGTDRFMDPATVAALSVAAEEEFSDERAFQLAASPAQAAFFPAALGTRGRIAGISLVESFEWNIAQNNNAMPISANPKNTNTVPGSPLLVSASGLAAPGGGTVATSKQAQTAWDAGAADELGAMQSTEQLIAGNIVTRAGQLQRAAGKTALTYGIITAVVLLIVLLGALAVARSLVLPLRRLRVGALDIASVQLPERVKLLTESPDAAATMAVAPINVADKHEIGEVARAFDQVHAEAVRLAGEQALLRSTFNAMFVNLSRRSQTLIERLARMIDNLEQEEADPDRLGDLFSMDHLVTRMRRNSENLLLLAGHENPRKWSEPVSLADVARAAISEIEQYNRITLNIPPGIAVVGVAVSDVAHLLAELIENATIFSPTDTRVQVVVQELSSGGVLIEISDKGIGVSEARLAEMNWRLDNRPTIDVSVSRHMGLFAVARLAERHGVRVRLRPALPQGLSALVWLSESVIERTSPYGSVGDWQSRPVGASYGTQSAAAVRQIGGMPEAAAALTRSGTENARSDAGPRVARGWFRDLEAEPGAASGNGGGNGGSNGGGGGTPQWTPPTSTLHGDQTSGGLPVRVPKSSQSADTAASSRTGGLPQRSDVARGGPQPRSGPATGSQPLPQRSPDQVRSRLAGFQRGNRRAETGQEQSPYAEGSER